MNSQTKEILNHFSEDIPTTLENVKKTGRLFMDGSGIRKKIGRSWTTFDFLLDKVTEIIPFEKGKWVDFWGVIKEPIKIKNIVFSTGVGEKAIKEDLKKLEKMKYIQTRLLPYGKIIFVRVFPEYANLIYKELPDFGKLCKKFKYYKKSGQEKEAQEIWDEIEKNLKRATLEKETLKERKYYSSKEDERFKDKESKPLTQEEVDERMKQLKEKLGLRKKEKQ